MRLLLDHCVDWRLKKSFPSHFVRCASDMGWERFSNGVLLAAAAGQFDVLITTDQNLRHQQNLAGFTIAVIVLAAKSNNSPTCFLWSQRWRRPWAPIKPASIVEIQAP